MDIKEFGENYIEVEKAMFKQRMLDVLEAIVAKLSLIRDG
jgi:hypothetical protein